MTMFRVGGDAKSDQRGYEFANGSGEVIPACAIMRITGGTAGIYNVGKPNADDIDSAVLLVNGEVEVAVGKNGYGTQDGPMLCLYDTADGTPSTGEKWGTGTGSWKLRKDKVGFLIHFASGTSGIVLATFKSCGCGDPGDPPEGFTASEDACFVDDIETRCDEDTETPEYRWVRLFSICGKFRTWTGEWTETYPPPSPDD